MASSTLLREGQVAYVLDAGEWPCAGVVAVVPGCAGWGVHTLTQKTHRAGQIEGWEEKAFGLGAGSSLLHYERCETLKSLRIQNLNLAF